MFTKAFHDKLVYSRRMMRLTELLSEVLQNNVGGGIKTSLMSGAAMG